MSVIYVLVEETGEYSSFAYDIHSYYHTMEDAENAKELIELEIQYKNELARVNGKWVDQRDFVIHQVVLGAKITSEELREKRNNAEMEYKPLIEAAKKAKDQKRMEKQIQEEIDLKVKLAEAKIDVDNFVEWYNTRGDGDAFFDNKLPARIREIKNVFQWYLRYSPTYPLKDFYDTVIMTKLV